MARTITFPPGAVPGLDRLLDMWEELAGKPGKKLGEMIGKAKTMAQMVAIPFLLYDGVAFGVIDTGVWGQWLIWIAAVLTVWSMVYYLQKALPEIRARL